MSGPETTKEQPRNYLILKGNVYYRPNRSGYTADPYMAGLYTEEEAHAEATVEPWRMKAVAFANFLPDARVTGMQAWLAEERGAGRLVFDVSDEWLGRLLNAAYAR